jgi:RNA-directed DNA polymerase
LKKILQKLSNKNHVTKEKLKELNARPLKIPSFKDKIVQEALRIILNTIDEPEFKLINTNYGFRENLGRIEAIRQLQDHAKAMNFAIEGDVHGAFDNVDFNILENLLENKIKDKRLTNLIRKSLECGIYSSGNIESSKIGTTQGSLLSPLFYNIYFNEFDKYIKTKFTKMRDQFNQEENRKARPAHKK